MEVIFDVDNEEFVSYMVGLGYEEFVTKVMKKIPKHIKECFDIEGKVYIVGSEPSKKIFLFINGIYYVLFYKIRKQSTTRWTCDWDLCINDINDSIIVFFGRTQITYTTRRKLPSI